MMEYAPNGTLSNLLKFNDFFEESTAYKFFIQIATAIYFLHQNILIHRD
jgi:serine/threonine protein kinase